MSALRIRYVAAREVAARAALQAALDRAYPPTPAPTPTRPLGHRPPREDDAPFWPCEPVQRFGLAPDDPTREDA